MINLAPGKGLGRVDRPFLAVELGYARSRSSLGVAADILSALPVSYLEGSEIIDLVSSEPPTNLIGMELFTVPGSVHTFAVMGSLVWNITSKEFVGLLTGDLPAAVASSLPVDTIISEEPT